MQAPVPALRPPSVNGRYHIIRGFILGSAGGAGNQLIEIDGLHALRLGKL